MNTAPDYAQLLEILVREFSWPSKYMFKFVVPFNPESLQQLRVLFDESAVISHRESKNSKFISFSAVQMMDNPDQIIAIYKQAEKIEKIVAL
jgi:hypothetical protein